MPSPGRAPLYAPRRLPPIATSTRPLLLVAIFLGAGAAVPAPTAARWACVLAALAAALLALAWRAASRAGTAAVWAAAIGIGAAAAMVEQLEYDQTPLARLAARLEDAGPVQVRGTARRDAVPGDPQFVLLLDVDELMVAGSVVPARGRARIDVGGEAARPEITDGDRVSVWAELRPPRTAGSPGAFDAAAQAFRAGIHATGHAKTVRLVTRGGRADVGWRRDFTARARRWARGRIFAVVPPGTEQALVRAMVLGDRAGLDDDTAEGFRIAGTYHVLALSGAQVALIAAVLIALARRVAGNAALTAVPVAAALVFYAQLVGGDVPIVRATVMAIVLLAGRALALDSDAANMLGLAALLLVVHRPSAIGDVGFQLSFAATLGLIVFTRPLVARVRALPFGLHVALAGSVAAQAPLEPLLAAQFHRIAPAALVLNLVAVPLSTGVLVAGSAAVAVSAISTGAGALVGQLAWLLAHALLASGEVARRFPALDHRMADPSPPVIALYVAGLGLLALRPGWRALLVALAGFAGLVAGPAPVADGLLHVTILDVGQGDSIVLRSPRGEAWVIDAGPAFGGRDMGEAVVAPYLWSAGITRIEHLLVTHPHPDHGGGVPFLLRAFDVGEVWEGVAPRWDPAYAALDRALRASAVTRRAVRRGLRAERDGVLIEVIGPAGSPPPGKTRNDDSLVVAVRYGAVRILLAGDVERAGEAALAVPPADALKVPHHGSRSSSTPALLAAARPRVAIVSAGYRSRFGHPHPDVVARYQGLGIPLLRTDRDGSVTLTTDGVKLWVATYRDGREVRYR